MRFYNVSLFVSIDCSVGSRVYFMIFKIRLREFGGFFVGVGEGRGPWR